MATCESSQCRHGGMKMGKNKRTIVFDLDGSLETPYFDKKSSDIVKAWMEKHPSGSSFDKMYAEVMPEKLPHFFFNGAFELLRWVNDHGFEIVFFSNAIEDRNKELCTILMERAFTGMKVPEYRIFSRGDCVDTRRIYDEKRNEAYQGLWRGNFKKKLADVIVPSKDLPNTLLIEDDNSYAARGEEQNLVYGVYGGCAKEFIVNPKLSQRDGHDFHLPFYFCGILSRIVSYADREGVSLVDAAVKVQYGDYLLDFPRDGERRKDSKGFMLDTPSPPMHHFRVYSEGLKELQTYNPGLRFWGAEVADDAWQWPDPKLPPPRPKKALPKIKTDMTRKEAMYWLARLQNTLRIIGATNVKTVALDGKDFRDGVQKGESGYIPMRMQDFEDEEYFDKTKVDCLYLYGYLPVNREREETGMPRYGRERTDEGTLKYRIFMHYIEEFLRECFGLYADVHNVKIEDCERWKIPVKPI